MRLVRGGGGGAGAPAVRRGPSPVLRPVLRPASAPAPVAVRPRFGGGPTLRPVGVASAPAGLTVVASPSVAPSGGVSRPFGGSFGSSGGSSFGGAPAVSSSGASASTGSGEAPYAAPASTALAPYTGSTGDTGGSSGIDGGDVTDASTPEEEAQSSALVPTAGVPWKLLLMVLAALALGYVAWKKLRRGS